MYEPEYKLNNEMTTAMLLAYNGIIPQKCWKHNPKLQNEDGYTVAMYIAKYCK